MMNLKAITFILFIFSSNYSQSRADLSLAMEGGSGFIHTKSAETHEMGFVGLSAYGIVSSVKLSRNQEMLFTGVCAFTYGATDKLELALILYSIGRGVINNEDLTENRFESGLGESQFAVKYKFSHPFSPIDWALRIALHAPLGVNFASHPSYPYDTDVYSLEMMGLQTFHISGTYQIHTNEGYRWRGLRSDSQNKDDLLLFTLCGVYRLNSDWKGFISMTSSIEFDRNIQPLNDRMVLTQGVYYQLEGGIAFNLAGSVRLNREREDPLKSRARNWRLFLGLTYGFNL